MDPMPHPEEEMVVDEDTFLNNTSNIDPRLLTQSQSQSPASVTTSQRTSNPTVPAQSFPLTDFYEYRHAGCLCKVKPETFPSIEMQFWEPPPSKRSVNPPGHATKLWIIWPLHCKMCSWAVSQRIFYTTQSRCQAISEKPIQEEIKNCLIAYEEGHRDVRIQTLNMTLDWSETHGS